LVSILAKQGAGSLTVRRSDYDVTFWTRLRLTDADRFRVV